MCSVASASAHDLESILGHLDLTLSEPRLPLPHLPAVASTSRLSTPTRRGPACPNMPPKVACGKSVNSIRLKGKCFDSFIFKGPVYDKRKDFLGY